MALPLVLDDNQLRKLKETEKIAEIESRMFKANLHEEIERDLIYLQKNEYGKPSVFYKDEANNFDWRVFMTSEINRRVEAMQDRYMDVIRERDKIKKTLHRELLW